ncbi:hypothetical protein [Candidatus Nitrososphaera sp. FF02]|uniref:hypothetical protein n=1 Tax=Candidatus Nitrososphaera sp. FF02 TaxID=3398226 RepID=UPI0039ED5877
MPANHKVSVGWQIVFTFITGLNFWAFYRIRKLRKYLLYVIVPELILTVAYFAFLSTTSVDDLLFQSSNTRLDIETSSELESEIEREFETLTTAYVIVTVIGLAFQGLTIYLVIIWSRAHNRAFGSPASRS